MNNIEHTLLSYRNAYNLIGIMEHKIICGVGYILKRTTFYKEDFFIAGIPCCTELQPQKRQVDESTWGEDFLPGVVFKYVIRENRGQKDYQDYPFSILKVSDNSMKRIFPSATENGQSFIVLLFYDGSQKNKFDIWEDKEFNEFLSDSIDKRDVLVRDKQDSNNISIAKKYMLSRLTSEDNANEILNDFNKILIDKGIRSIIK